MPYVSLPVILSKLSAMSLVDECVFRFDPLTPLCLSLDHIIYIILLLSFESPRWGLGVVP